MPSSPPFPIGVAFSDLPALRDYRRYARMAEDLGYESVWVTEPRLARDAFTGMALAAAATDRLRIASAVVNNWTRGPGVMASTVAALESLAPRRITLGIGAYWDPLAAKQGIQRRKPVTAMREYIDIVRGLLRLERVTYHGEIYTVVDLELDGAHADELGYEDLYSTTPMPVPIVIGATGPRMLDLAAEIADGVILTSALPLSYVSDAARTLRLKRQRSAREQEPFQISKILMVSVTNQARSSDSVRKKITRYLGQQPHVRAVSGLSESTLTQIQSETGGWPPRPGGIESAMELVTDQVVDRFAVVGSLNECRARIGEYVAAGVDLPILKIEGGDFEDVLRSLAPNNWGTT